MAAEMAEAASPKQSPHYGAEPQKEERRIRVALIGTGRCARAQFAPAILQNPMFHLRVVWSRTQASATRFNLEVAGRSLEVFHGEEGLQRLLERSDVMGYAIALPAAVQAPYVDRVLRHYRHVFSEAPAALDRNVALEMLKCFEECRESRCVWFVANPMRYEPVFQSSSMRLETIGPVFAAELYGVLVLDPSSVLDGPPRTEESLFIESGVQHIAVLQQVLGNIIEVNCIQASKAPGQRQGDGREDNTSAPSRPTLFWEDTLSGVLRFESGLACTLNWQTSANEEDRRFRLTLRGARGSMTVEQEATSGILRYILKRSPPTLSASGRQPSAATSVSAGWERQLEAWGRSIRAASSYSASDEDPATASHAIVDVLVLTAMLQSRGSKVQITRAQEKAKIAG